MKKALCLFLFLLSLCSVAAAEAQKEIVFQMTYTCVLPDVTREGKYTGEVINGIPNGFGVFQATNSKGIDWHYIGNWTDGMMNGKGGTYWDKGQVDIGIYVNNDFYDGERYLPKKAEKISAGKSGEANIDPAELGMWSLDYYVDEFNLPTETKYIYASVRGTFSNSATTNSSLLVRFLIDKDKVTIKLYEYESHVVKNYYSSDTKLYKVAMLDSNGTRYGFDGFYYRNADRMYFEDEAEKAILDVLSQNDTVRFSVREPSSGSSYSFVIEDTSYFTNAYNALLAE